MNIKTHLVLFTLFLLFLTPGCGSSPKDPLPLDVIRSKQITELQSQLQQQQQHNQRWQLISAGLGVGCLALLILGTSLGSKTRHDALS